MCNYTVTTAPNGTFDCLDPTKQACRFCNKRQATSWWVDEGGAMALAHGMGAPICDRCALERQLAHAREMAASIPKLEADLAEIDRLEANGAASDDQ